MWFMSSTTTSSGSRNSLPRCWPFLLPLVHRYTASISIRPPTRCAKSGDRVRDTADKIRELADTVRAQKEAVDNQVKAITATDQQIRKAKDDVTAKPKSCNARLRK